MSKSALAASVLVLLALAPVAMADEGFHVTVKRNGLPRSNARVELWIYSSPAQDTVKETEAYTDGSGHVEFYKGNPVGTCDIPYSSENRWLKAFFQTEQSAWSGPYVYDSSEDLFVFDLNLIPEE